MIKNYIKKRFGNIFTHNKDINSEIKKIYELKGDNIIYSSSIKYMFDNINKNNVNSYGIFTDIRPHMWIYFESCRTNSIAFRRGVKTNDLKYCQTIKTIFFTELYNFMVFIKYKPFLNHIKKSRVFPYAYQQNCPQGFGFKCPCSDTKINSNEYHKNNMSKQDLVGTFIGLYYIPTNIYVGDYGMPNGWNCGIGLRTDDKPYEYIGIYLTYMSIIKNLNLKKFISIENYTFNTQLEESKIPKIYIASEKDIELDIGYSDYELEKYHLEGNKIIYIYSKKYILYKNKLT